MAINVNKKPKAPLHQHEEHQAEIRPGKGPHLARFWCLDCNCHIAWVKRSQINVQSKE
jgi:hypothetical protein